MNAWNYYRKTFLPIQATILGISAVLYFYAKLPLQGVLCFLAPMEVGAVAGALWGTRLVRKGTARRPDALPLQRR